MSRLEVPPRVAVLVTLALLGGVFARPGHPQALAIDHLANGTALLRVETALADATSVAWLEADGSIASVSGGDLTLTLALQEALQVGQDDVDHPAPPAIVAVGATGGDDLLQQLDGWLTGREPAARPEPANEALREGAVTRRLRPAGAPSTLALTLPLPDAGSAIRSDVEVLCAALPALVRSEVPHLRVSTGPLSAKLTTRIDPELADMTMRRLRLALAQLATANVLERGTVETTRHRLLVARRAQLGEHPESAVTLVELWRAGGAAGVQQHLFGLESVTLESVRAAAAAWLPLHPGHATVDLPPHAMSPRFASGPRRAELDNGAIVSLLERPGTDLATLVVRPVLLPDLDGELSATVLTRLAAALREGPVAPEWTRVHPSPPWLELAAPPDRFAELVEATQMALASLWSDTAPAAVDTTDPRRAALDLLALRLAAARQAGEVTPAELLRPSNLVLGGVVADAETATEALDKLLDRNGELPRALTSSAMTATSRSRIAMSGSRGALVAAIELPADSHWSEARVIQAVLADRASDALELDVRVDLPLVPGRRLVLVSFRGRGTLEAVEEAVRSAWPGLVAPIDGDDLAPHLHRVAAAITRAGSGAMGRARTAAAVAAGVRQWEPAMATQLRVLTLSPDRIDALLASARDLQSVELTGAGRLPVDTMPMPQ